MDLWGFVSDSWDCVARKVLFTVVLVVVVMGFLFVCLYLFVLLFIKTHILFSWVRTLGVKLLGGWQRSV